MNLNEIKARCEAAKPPAHCRRCDWFKDVPALVAEVERLRGGLEEFEFIFRNKQSKPFRSLHKMAVEALEAK